MKLGEIIREYRAINHMSMGDFARASGISKPYVSMLEADKNSNGGKAIIPSVATLKKVSSTVGLSLDDLLRKLGDEKIDLRPPNFSEDEKALVDNYRGLNAEDKDFLWNVIRRLLPNNERVVAHNLFEKNNPSGNNFGVVGGNFNANVSIR